MHYVACWDTICTGRDLASLTIHDVLAEIANLRAQSLWHSPCRLPMYHRGNGWYGACDQDGRLLRGVDHYSSWGQCLWQRDGDTPRELRRGCNDLADWAPPHWIGHDHRSGATDGALHPIRTVALRHVRVNALVVPIAVAGGTSKCLSRPPRTSTIDFVHSIASTHAFISGEIGPCSRLKCLDTPPLKAHREHMIHKARESPQRHVDRA